MEYENEEDVYEVEIDGARTKIFLSLKDDYYRTHMFAYFRKLGALKQFLRDTAEEKKVKEEAYMFFMNSGCRMMKYHDWKRPDMGHSEVDNEYARRSECEFNLYSFVLSIAFVLKSSYLVCLL